MRRVLIENRWLLLACCGLLVGDRFWPLTDCPVPILDCAWSVVDCFWLVTGC